MIYLTLDTVIGNALIERLQHLGERSVNSQQVTEYANRVLAILNKDNWSTIFECSRDDRCRVEQYYGSIFRPTNVCIELMPDVTSSDLWKNFRNYLSVPVMNAFRDPSALEALGIKR